MARNILKEFKKQDPSLESNENFDLNLKYIKKFDDASLFFIRQFILVYNKSPELVFHHNFHVFFFYNQNDQDLINQGKNKFLFNLRCNNIYFIRLIPYSNILSKFLNEWFNFETKDIRIIKDSVHNQIKIQIIVPDQERKKVIGRKGSQLNLIKTFFQTQVESDYRFVFRIMAYGDIFQL